MMTGVDILSSLLYRSAPWKALIPYHGCHISTRLSLAKSITSLSSVYLLLTEHIVHNLQHPAQWTSRFLETYAPISGEFHRKISLINHTSYPTSPSLLTYKTSIYRKPTPRHEPPAQRKPPSSDFWRIRPQISPGRVNATSPELVRQDEKSEVSSPRCSARYIRHRMMIIVGYCTIVPERGKTYRHGRAYCTTR
jgi:hypothetical protein